MRCFTFRHGFRRTGDENFAAAATAFRAEVDNPVCRFNNVQIVFDYHDGVALIAQLVQNIKQLLNIGKMQTGGRLIKNIQRLSRCRVSTVRAPASRAGPRRRKA
ncbi:Uncharacterised protein [Salmonella bongori]|nr:Uncharacterised protein [Salmonella bongori]